MSSVGEQEKVVPGQPKEKPRESLLMESIQRILLSDPNRAYRSEDLMRVLKLSSPKDLQKEAQTLEQIASILLSLSSDDGLIREVAPHLFKARLFFDKAKSIEHAFVGGMGNTCYCFNAKVFRLNIGVLSMFFIKIEQAKRWRVSIFDTTIGRNYCLVKPLSDGVHLFGTNPEKADGTSVWAIEGKYIEKRHATLTLSGNRIEVEDHRTLRGTRIDHLTDRGFSDYLQAAGEFLKSVDKGSQQDIIKRGRFALEQLLQHHKNFETSFFNAVVDFILLKEL